jgi:acyl-coenzyme A synthetase/AMP-(fatty) acid ligase
MTETFGPYCGDRLDTDLSPGKRGSCGRPFEGMDVRIFDLETGDRCPPGVDGEIGVRGPNVMRGICGQTRSETFDANGYYRTGDLGNLDVDGYLWYRSRRDDMFKVSGATVYPAEVEGALQGVHGVRQAFVANVPSERGEQVGALVVTDLSVDALDVAVRARLSSFKVPTLWYVTDQAADVPRTATDKVAKPALQALLEQHGARAGVGPDLRPQQA